MTLFWNRRCFERPLIDSVYITGPNPDRPLPRMKRRMLCMVYRYFRAIRGQYRPEEWTRNRENKIVRKMIGCERFAMNCDLDRLPMLNQLHRMLIQSCLCNICTWQQNNCEKGQGRVHISER